MFNKLACDIIIYLLYSIKYDPLSRIITLLHCVFFSGTGRDKNAGSWNGWKWQAVNTTELHYQANLEMILQFFLAHYKGNT